MNRSETTMWARVAEGLRPEAASADVVDAFVAAICAVRGAEPWDRLGAPVGVAARVAVVLRGADWVAEHGSWPPPPVRSSLPATLIRIADHLTAATGHRRWIDHVMPLDDAEVSSTVRFLLGLADGVPEALAQDFERRGVQVADADAGCQQWLSAGDPVVPDDDFWAVISSAPPSDPLAGIALGDPALAGGLRHAVRRVLAAADGDTGLAVLEVPLACWWVAGGRFRFESIVADPDQARLDLTARLQAALGFVGARADVPVDRGD